jgi:hypothetical protein
MTHVMQVYDKTHPRAKKEQDIDPPPQADLQVRMLEVAL